MNRPVLRLIIIAVIINCSGVSAQVAARFEILITEIFPDPSPSIGLPANEFIEIRNVSLNSYNLKDWKIGDESSVGTIAINFILQPEGVAIICSSSATVNFISFGNTIGVTNFPSLDNEADEIVLRSKEGIVIHAISYNIAWYKNELKAKGGWTLEMIDTKNPCAGISNWNACAAAAGGTPGKTNSVNGINEDDGPPALIRTYALDSVTIAAVFDEPLDSISASFASKYLLDKTGISPMIAVPRSPLFTEVILKFSQPLTELTIYNLTVSGITDCRGNPVGFKNNAKSGLSTPVEKFDVVINELLFNPKGNGFDFIELYNKSDKVIELSSLYLANRNTTGSLINTNRLSVIPYLLFPGEFIVFTENAEWLKQNYILHGYDNLITLSSLPSLPDDEGTLVIATVQEKLIEEIHYNEKWHFALIENNEGISLERIDYSAPGQDQNNWTSAASTIGFATPGYQNSQFKADIRMQGMISTNSKTFSPDNDGFEDLAAIKYQMAGPGFVANITIFDANGRTVRYLAKNATLSLQGIFHWDGLDDKLQRLPVGIYIVFTEIFNLQGKTKKFKNVITLARRF